MEFENHISLFQKVADLIPLKIIIFNNRVLGMVKFAEIVDTTKSDQNYLKELF